jgi:hypothetical protein
MAVPGEVLVSSTVKELVVGSGIEFADRGAQTLKGVPGEWRLYALTREQRPVVQSVGDEGEGLPSPDEHLRQGDRAMIAAAKRMPAATRAFARLATRRASRSSQATQPAPAA